MKLFLLKNISGIHLFNEDFSFIETYPFNKQEIESLDDSQLCELFEKAKKNSLLLLNDKIKSKTELEGINEVTNIIDLNENSEKYSNIILSFLVRFSNKEFFNLSRAVLSYITANRLKHLDEDKIIIQHVETLDQVTKVFNILMKRIREYYSVKSPELSNLINNNEILLSILRKDNILDVLKEKQIEPKLTVTLPNEDESEIKGLVELAYETLGFLDETKDLITKKMGRLMPRTSEIATPLIGAKLLTLAGGLERLAFMPSSRIQLLGAEKALFKHLKQGSKPPKYGILYQHPSVLNAEKKDRGKAARKIASKISIAVRQDYFKQYNKR